MRTRISRESLRSELVQQIEFYSGVNLLACNQCGKCSSGCPVAFSLDVLPSQIIRMAQLGMEDVLIAEMIWTCASCMTCVARCPKGIDLPRVMEAIRQLALRDDSHRFPIEAIDEEHLGELPQIALIGGYRKFTG